MKQYAEHPKPNIKSYHPMKRLDKKAFTRGQTKYMVSDVNECYWLMLFIEFLRPVENKNRKSGLQLKAVTYFIVALIISKR